MYKNTDKLSNGKPTEDVNSLCKENYVRNPPCRKMPVALEIRDMQINSSVLKCNVISLKREREKQNSDSTSDVQAPLATMVPRLAPSLKGLAILMEKSNLRLARNFN